MKDLSKFRRALAEMAGLKLGAGMDSHIYFGPNAFFCKALFWHPDLDIEQAFRCLESWVGEHKRGWIIGQDSGLIKVDLYDNETSLESSYCGGKPLAYAICRTIIAALDLKPSEVE